MLELLENDIPLQEVIPLLTSAAWGPAWLRPSDLSEYLQCDFELWPTSLNGRNWENNGKVNVTVLCLI